MYGKISDVESPGRYFRFPLKIGNHIVTNNLDKANILAANIATIHNKTSDIRLQSPNTM